MDIHSFYENIKSQAEAINVNLNNEMCEQFYYYMKLMLEWNENINLTAIICLLYTSPSPRDRG